jgi:hypothetical protein
MKTMNFLRIFLFISLVLTEFFSGIGFVNAVGLIPTRVNTPMQQVIPSHPLSWAVAVTIDGSNHASFRRETNYTASTTYFHS